MAAQLPQIHIARTGKLFHRRRNCTTLTRATARGAEVKTIRQQIVTSPSGLQQVRHRFRRKLAGWPRELTRYSCSTCGRD